LIFFLEFFFPKTIPIFWKNFFNLKFTQKKKKKKKNTLCQLIFFSLLWYPKISNFLGQIYNFKKTQFYPKTFQMFLVKRMIAFVLPKNTTIGQILIFTK